MDMSPEEVKAFLARFTFKEKVAIIRDFNNIDIVKSVVKYPVQGPDVTDMTKMWLHCHAEVHYAASQPDDYEPQYDC